MIFDRREITQLQASKNRVFFGGAPGAVKIATATAGIGAIFSTQALFLPPFAPKLSHGQTGFVQKTGFNPVSSQGQPGQKKVDVYVPFSCLRFGADNEYELLLHKLFEHRQGSGTSRQNTGYIPGSLPRNQRKQTFERGNVYCPSNPCFLEFLVCMSIFPFSQGF